MADVICSICKKPRGAERWTRNGGKPAHVRCALAEGASSLASLRQFAKQFAPSPRGPRKEKS